MVKETESHIEESVIKESKKQQPKKFGKAAHLFYASNINDRLLLDVLLEEDKKYTKTEVIKIVRDWKQKEVKA